MTKARKQLRVDVLTSVAAVLRECAAVWPRAMVGNGHGGLVAVAAASILARESFIDWLRDARAGLGFELPKGASAQVKEVGREIASKHGADGLGKVAKMHFKTATEILSGNA